MSEARRSAPAALRNRGPILEVLREQLGDSGLLLEVASGTGEHALHIAAALRGWTIQPSDPGPEARASIDAWAGEAGLPNLRPALELDAAAPDWPIAAADAVLCINMIHIAPWRAALGLLAGAARILPAGAPLVLYGPFREPGVPLAESNAAFDRSLRERDPEWGLRDLGTVTEAAVAAGFVAGPVVPMPANNLTVVFRRGG
ncbi:DUF938 domain-containing protein [Roseomonas sp. M0104]|uniref:DUF938 domain-containing protein n=1 Tax=Teichococcus coralli TaxID=2545983 RepID=A0A845BM43_9PROT|nr:DUF938 domain-containing protein [Pseudoroseomonas coralli]MXP64479.1 DUF938 domain-containing protein [Pseudoroseomonas coralli]